MGQNLQITSLTHSSSKHDEKNQVDTDKTGQKDKTGQNLKENKKENKKEKENNLLSGCAALIDDRDKTRDFNFDRGGTKVFDTTFDRTKTDKTPIDSFVPMTTEQRERLRKLGYSC